MKTTYDTSTDSRYIDLSETPSAESEEVAPGIVLGFAADWHVVGLDIDRANGRVLPVGPSTAPRETKAGVNFDGS